MRWEQLKGNSWASEETRENHCAMDALINEVSVGRPRWGSLGSGRSVVGTLKASGSDCES